MPRMYARVQVQVAWLQRHADEDAGLPGDWHCVQFFFSDGRDAEAGYICEGCINAGCTAKLVSKEPSISSMPRVNRDGSPDAPDSTCRCECCEQPPDTEIDIKTNAWGN